MRMTHLSRALMMPFGRARFSSVGGQLAASAPLLLAFCVSMFDW